MGGEQIEVSGPDFGRGVPLAELADGATVAGQAQGQPVLVARRGDEIFAVSAKCTHYGAPLGDGLVVGDTVRCPWHHACFDLRTGAPIRPPALGALARWEVERRDDVVYVTRERAPETAPVPAPRRDGAARRGPSSVVIVGGGAAGDAAAEELRREGYDGPITLVSADAAAPCDRPNLSKDYLAGNAPEEWIPLRAPSFYEEHGIDLVLDRQVTALDLPGRRVVLDGGASREFGALLLATGARPVQLPTPAYGGSRLLYLRTLADSRAIVAAADAGARRAVVLGASFIGLEVAASLRARGLEVHVVAPEHRPLERVMGPELGDHVRALHEAHGVVFHMGRTASQVDAGEVTLGSGERVPADLVVAGVGVRPNEELAAGAGLTVERGVVVDEYLQTSAPDVYAAGDVARYPDPRGGSRIRVEHWVVAQRMGQTAARNIVRGASGGGGAPPRERFDAVPFFWSQHYDVSIRYVGHAERWDETQLDGSLAANDCTVAFRSGGKTLAVAAIGRDRAGLEAELAMERGGREPMTVHG